MTEPVYARHYQYILRTKGEVLAEIRRLASEWRRDYKRPAEEVLNEILELAGGLEGPR